MNKIDNISIDEMQRLYEEENLSFRQLAKHYNVSFQSIQKWFVKFSIKPKPRGRALTELDEDEALRLYHEEKLPTTEVARRSGVNTSRIDSLFKRYGIEKIQRRGRKKGGLIVDRLRKMEINQRELFTFAGKSYNGLYITAKRIGIKISVRSRGDALCLVTRIG